MAKDDNKTFQDFFAEGMESLASTAFPQLSKFMDFNRDKKKDEDNASDSVSEQEDEDKPDRRRKSVNAVANEMVLDSLGAIDERLKVQSIVLVSQLEQQTITNQLLTRLATGGGMGGGPGGSSGGGGIVDAATSAIGGAAIGNFIKSWGTKILGGAASALMLPEVAIPAAVAAAGAGAVVGGNAILKGSDNEDMGPNAKNKTGDALQAEITALRDDIEREKKHLALNPTDTATLAILKKLEEKLDKDLGNSAVDDTKKAATPNYGPWHYGGTPSGPIIANPADIPTAAGLPMSGEMPLHNGGAYAPTTVPSGESPLSIVRGGGAGVPAGGGGMTRGAGRASKVLTANQQIAYDQFIKDGTPDDAARVIVGGLSGESLADPTNVHADPSHRNPNQKAHGIASWDDERSARIAALNGGKMPNEMPLTDQAHAVIEELKAHYPKVWADLNNPNLSPQEKMHSYIKNFESPRDPEGETNRRMGYMQGFHPGSNKTFTPPKNAGEVIDHLKKARDAGLVSNDECVALAAAAVGIPMADKNHPYQFGGNVHDWKRGEDVLAGNTKPGTPIASMLDRQGNKTSDYGHGSPGGGGTRGAGLDHAGVFEDYLRDEKGNIIRDSDGRAHGFTMAEQYAKTKGQVLSTAYTRGGYGERNADNYGIINTTRGTPLGGPNNPMTLHDNTGMPHRPYSPTPTTQPHRPVSTAMRGHRPEEGRDTAADAIDLQKYKQDFDAYSDNARENNRANAFHHKDTSPSVSSTFVQKSHEEAVRSAAMAQHQSQVTHKIATHAGGAAQSLTPNEKSGRLSDKEVGNPNPPASRLRELFVNTENTKGF